MIRQAISCDICGAEKKQTNHWFVAHELSGELRVSQWSSRNRMRPGSKHLCGQTCLHKLVDDFMARDLAAAAQRGAQEDFDAEDQVECAETGLKAEAACVDRDSSARLIAPQAPVLPQQIPFRAGAGLVAVPRRSQAEAPLPSEETPGTRLRNLRVEAWNRERERELRAMESQPDVAVRRRAGS